MFSSYFRPLCFCVGAILIFVIWGATAEAEEASDQDEARAEARTLFERGLELVDQERWEDALEAFDDSLQLYPTQTALFNRALCYGLAGRPLDAVRDLEAHLAEYGDSVEESRRTAVEDELERQRRRVGRISIEVEGDEAAEVLVDGIERGSTPLSEAVTVNPGRHQVTLRAEGFEQVDRWVIVGGGDETALVVALTRTPTGEGESAPMGSSTETRRDGRGLRIGGALTAGVAVVALGVALGLFIWNEGRFETWQEEDDFIRAALEGAPPATTGDIAATGLDRRIADNDDLGEAIQDVDGVSWAMIAVGTGAAIASVVLFVLGARRGRQESPSVSLHPSPGGLLLAGRF